MSAQNEVYEEKYNTFPEIINQSEKNGKIPKKFTEIPNQTKGPCVV